MGIERFFASISTNKIIEDFTHKLHKKLDIEHLFIDFNSIVYITSTKVLTDLNYILYHVIIDHIDGQIKKKIDDICNKYNLDVKLTFDDMTKEISNEKINKIILKEIRKYVFMMLNTFINCDKLELLYIAMDGVPSKSKILEQKKRRYMGAIMGEIKKKIYDKHRNDLKNHHELRYMYEENKFHWNRNLITPGTEFMNDIIEMLSDISFEVHLKETCKNIKKYVFSGSNEPGEGEKKIVDYVKSLDGNDENKITAIYSPDSDVTLLAMLLHTDKNYNKLSLVTMIRHNQQEDDYDVIDIPKLSNSLFNYINEGVKLTKTIELDKDRVINDIVFIFTIFGNDFLPKLESFSVSNDFKLIIDEYIKLLITTKGKYIISTNKEKMATGNKKTNKIIYKKVLSQSVLLILFHNLKQNEGGKLQNIYLSSNYKNYRELQKIFHSHNNLNEEVYLFLSTLKKFNEQIKSNKTDNLHFQNGLINRIRRLNNDLSKYTDNVKFVEEYKKHYDKTNKYPSLNILLQSYDNTINSNFHINKLNRSFDFIGQHVKITKYDEEMYKFDNMLDEYYTKLNAQHIELGPIRIDVNANNEYTLVTDEIETSVQNFYRDYFGIHKIDFIKNKFVDGKMEKLLSSYYEGLVWVFDYYYNHFDIDENRDYANIWFYNYSYAPLLTQLYLFLGSKTPKGKPHAYLKDVQSKIQKYIILRTKYFDSIEHLLYSSPVKIFRNIVPTEYKKFVDQWDYIDVSEIVKDIWKNDENNNINCHGVTFLVKCHLTFIKEPFSIIQSYKNDLKFISQIRKINVTYDTLKLKGKYVHNRPNVLILDYHDVIQLDQVKKVKPIKNQR